ncbi:MAG: hypothetical protein HKN88_09155 [Gammaproteobacteria bacterium]|nr:hypothetical protein [Gammaproteobacteria bacterium]NNM14567.1 hypothetical protein [Gammaproteobacteria bacterium]
MQNELAACALCGRNQFLTFHHLIPRMCHRKKYFRSRFTKSEMQTRGLDICQDCHHFIHTQKDEKTLGREFNTLDALKNAEWMKTFIAWVVKKK